MTWAERAADRSPLVQRSRSRGVQQATAIVDAARRLMMAKGSSFTTQELVKEAGIALQTFYRYFPGKDHLLLAVFESMIDESCAGYRRAGSGIGDPTERIRFYIHSALDSLDRGEGTAHLITAEHWRLQSLYPEEVARATRPFTDLLLEAIGEGTALGLIAPGDPAYAAWLMNQLVMATFHHYACAGADEPAADIADRLWQFVATGLGVATA